IYCEVFKNNLHFQDFNVFLKENQWLSKCNCDINNWCLSVYPWINCGTFFKCFPCSPLIISFNKPVSVNLNVLNEKNVHEQLCIKTSLF
ncbi:MAG: hypothetical protein LBF02_02200, partial [Mycoplasmataceae bacterium]|nr:hypothetical protein [Mycoplasmataceae bacterium]